MSKAIIGIDIDNVCCTTTQAVLDHYNELANDNLVLTDVSNYYIEKFVKDEFKKDFYKIFLEPAMWKRIQLIPDSDTIINKLLSEDYRIIFVTSTEPYNFFKKSEWLGRIFPDFDLRSNLISIKDKQLISQIDLLIDDYPKNLQDKVDDYGNLMIANYKKILFDFDGQYMWTKDFQEDNVNSFRSYNWNDVYHVVHKLFD